MKTGGRNKAEEEKTDELVTDQSARRLMCKLTTPRDAEVVDGSTSAAVFNDAIKLLKLGSNQTARAGKTPK